MTCDELRRDAVGLASLPAHDLARSDAERHAAGCPGCALALVEAARVLALIDALPPPPRPSLEVLERVRVSIAAEWAYERQSTRRFAKLAPTSLLLVLGGFLLVAGRHLDGNTPAAPIALVALALIAGGAALTRGLGRLPVGVMVAASMLAVLSGAHGDEMAWAKGISCTAIELVTGTLPVAGLAVIAWRARVRRPGLENVSPWLLGSLGAAGALAGQAGLMLSCHSRALGHELLFHAGGVALAAVLAALAARHRPFRRASA